MSRFSTEDLKKAASLIAAHAETVSDYLNAADGKLGDGDLGITFVNGWQEVAGSATTFPADVGMAFLECSKAFQRASSSSFGTLVATAFMSAAKNCKGQDTIPFESVAGLLRDACAAMTARGKGELGDKSVLDVVHAMAGAAEEITQSGELLEALASAIKETLDRFRAQPNKLGRARMFGEKSIGLDDPGMLAVQEMVKPLLED